MRSGSTWSSTAPPWSRIPTSESRVFCLSIVAAGAVLLAFKTYSTFTNVKPLIVRINDVGRAEVVQYNAMEYTPREAELKYFLTQFVHDFYSRNRMTVRDDFSRSLYFLERQL